MDLMLVLLAVTAFPVGCLLFVLWMGRLEDSIPAGVRRAVRKPDPPPILAVPVRRTAPAAAGWWERVAVEENPTLAAAEVRTRPGGTPHSAGQDPAPGETIPEQRTPVPPTSPLPAPALPAPGPLAGT